MDDDSIRNLTNWSMKLYDSCAPLRKLVAAHPELKEPIVEALGKALTESFRPMWQGPVNNL